MLAWSLWFHGNAQPRRRRLRRRRRSTSLCRRDVRPFAKYTRSRLLAPARLRQLSPRVLPVCRPESPVIVAQPGCRPIGATGELRFMLNYLHWPRDPGLSSSR